MLNAVRMVVWHVTSPVRYAIPQCSGHGAPPPPLLRKILDPESIRILSNFNFQWTKTLYQSNLNNIAFFFTFFKS